MKRLAPVKPGDPNYRQIWRVVDGAVAAALAAHPEYLASKAQLRTVRNSIVKRVVGAVHGYAEQSAWVRSGSSPADAMAAHPSQVPARGCDESPVAAAVATCGEAGRGRTLSATLLE